MAERREENRADVEVVVHFRTAQEFLAAYSKNISGGGILIRSQQPQPLNRNVLLRFTLPGVPHRFDVQGMVVWSNPVAGRSAFPAGMGIKFLELGAQEAALIADFVARATAAMGHGVVEGGVVHPPTPPPAPAAQPAAPVPPPLPAARPAVPPARTPAAGQAHPAVRPASPPTGQAVRPPASGAAHPAPTTQRIPPTAGAGTKKP